MRQHRSTLRLMQQKHANKQAFTVEYMPAAVAAENDQHIPVSTPSTLRKATRSGWLAVMCAIITPSTMLSPDKMDRPVGLVGFSCLTIAAMLTTLLAHVQRVRARDVLSIVLVWTCRTLLLCASFAFSMGIMFFGQEIWRCTSDMCWQGTMFPSIEACRVPCSSAERNIPYAPRAHAYVALCACVIGLAALFPFAYFHANLPKRFVREDEDSALRTSQEPPASGSETWVELNDAALAAREAQCTTGRDPEQCET